MFSYIVLQIIHLSSHHHLYPSTHTSLSLRMDTPTNRQGMSTNTSTTTKVGLTMKHCFKTEVLSMKVSY